MLGLFAMPSGSSGIVETPQLTLAKAILQIIGGAARHFPADLVRDPPLAILLHTFVAAEEGRHVSIAALGELSALAPSTALRWVARLETEGYIHRIVDQHDRRRSWVEISTDGSARMCRWLQSLDVPETPVRLH